MDQTPPPSRITEPARRPLPVRRIPLGVAVRRTIAAAAVATALLFGGLALQMERGQDPALGSGSVGSSSQPSPPVSASSPVVTSEESDDGGDDGGTITVQTQTQTQAPAPAPAPVQTSTS